MEKTEPWHCGWECRLGQPLWKPVPCVLEKLKTELPYDPGVSLWGIYLKKFKTLKFKKKSICVFIAALFTIAKIWKQLSYQ